MAIAFALLVPDLGALWSRTLIWIIQTQRELHRALSQAMAAVREDADGALWSMVSLSFLYGVFHAAGPGHGKVVISAYLATHESRLGRGLLLTGLSSFAQALTAIALVGVLVFLLGWSMRSAESSALVLESASYGLVTLLGVCLACKSARCLRRSLQHDHGPDCGCGHAHGADAMTISRRGTAGEFMMTVLSIGIRPCSGGVLVMLLATSIGQAGAGVAAVLAMALGTAITVSLLAVLSIYARQAALKLASGLDGADAWLGLAANGLALLGGLILIAAGSSLLLASWRIAQHPLL
jgi:ABC-type nickel/cobalt efflux system permease component RcnA